MTISTKVKTKFEDLVKVTEQSASELLLGHRNIKIDTMKKTISFYLTNYNCLKKFYPTLNYNNGWDKIDTEAKDFSCDINTYTFVRVKNSNQENILLGSLPFINPKFHDALKSLVLEAILSSDLKFSTTKNRRRDEVKQGCLFIDCSLSSVDLYDE